ncbi:MAG: heavy metal sensor histidine kinase [bacterium]
MSSKNAESTTTDKYKWSFPRSLSITGRLTFLYTLSALGILAVSAVFLYWVLVSNLRREDSQSLAEEIQVLRGILQDRSDEQEVLEQDLKWEEGSSRYYKYYIRVLDEQGPPLIETPGMDRIIAAPQFPKPIGITEMPETGTKWRSDDGRPFLLMAAWAELGHSGGNHRLLQVALDVSHEDALIAEYRRKLVVVLLLGTLFSAGVGVAVARRGMKPLEEITRAVQRISVTQLHERIAPAQWPRELATLAIAFDGMLNRLEDSFTRLSQFSADLAHELRTPITNVMGEAEVALSRTRTPAEYRQVLESSLEEYARLSHIVESLLFLARAESSKMRIERSLFNGLKEMEAVREFFDAVAEEEGVEVICQGEEQLCADSILFRQALSNLLSNALHHTPRNGKILLSIQQTEDGWVEVTTSDSGCGIDPEHLPRLFDRFYRVDRARSRKTSGTGLGLAIVRSIMELHGGAVAIQSKPAKGTTVILRFPPPA